MSITSVRTALTLVTVFVGVILKMDESVASLAVESLPRFPAACWFNLSVLPFLYIGFVRGKTRAVGVFSTRSRC